MKRWRGKPSLMLALVGALIALLPLLAVLQFRWLGEVSQAERDRMQASLKSAVANFTQDFDRELSRACLSLQMDTRTERERDWTLYARHYDQWAQTAPYPQLVSGVYLAEPVGPTDVPEHVQLYRFERATVSFTPADWPAGLEGLRAALEQEFEAARLASRFIYQSSVDVIDTEATALVMPVADQLRLDGPVLLPFSFTSRVILTLDGDFIREQFIPQLAARYFTSSTGQDYRLVITRRDNPAKVVYQTESGAAMSVLASADASGALFGLRAETPVHIEGITHEVEQSKTTGSTKEHTSVRFFNLAMKRASAPVNADAEKDSTMPNRFGAADQETGRWLIALQHRAGSLDAAVGAARRRNLAMSFGILLLLSVSIALILISTRRAERLARQQMEFVAGVSHEMRTPLAVICSAGENLADGVIETGEQVRRYGALIEGEGRRLSEMIEQALEFAGIQSGRKAYALRPTEARRVVEDALAACAPLIEEGGFTVEREIADDLPPIAADAAAMSRAVQNLLNNAMKYGGEPGWIRLTARATASEVQITIEDRGLGIAATDLPHIFEPFYRGSEVTAAQIHGSGLGLSLVKHIIEAHGGRVLVQSTAGRGSAFTLSLPALMQTDAAGDEVMPFTAQEGSEV